ncbi:MAG: phosphoglycerate kinase [bacterium]|nr:phosphoglycerate kinase [bacterium]
MINIKDIPDIKGKRVLLRLDLNVPIENDRVRDSFRIDKALPTLRYLRSMKAKVVILAHIESDRNSLLPVYEYIHGFFNIEFAKNLDDAEVIVKSMKDGECLLVENLRNYKGEKDNDEAFSRRLASLGDIYVNDAFSVSHRAHASVVGVPKFLPHYAGPLLEEEVKNLETAFNPLHPFLFILGGAKFGTKIPLINRFLNIADNVFISGALANDIYKVKGYEVGRSLISLDSKFDKEIKEIISNNKIIVPEDVVIEDTEKNVTSKPANYLDIGDLINDTGPLSIAKISETVKNYKYVLWNGPLGNYENGFVDGTANLARALAEATEKSGVKTIVGGGDTLAVIASLGLMDKFTFLSTGGGAMLDFLANTTLPGIEALK